jgi:hypothetical protein
MSLLLSDAERDRFAAWLEHEAKQSALMAKVMEDNKMPDELIRRERAEATAAALIARKLRQTESFSVGRE